MKSATKAHSLTSSKSGFTLIEVVIAMTIMATLTVLSTQNIQTALRTKIKLTQQIDDMSQVRDALRVMEKDINLAFHYRDLEKEMREEIKKGSSAKTTPTPKPKDGFFPGQDANPFNPGAAPGAESAEQKENDTYRVDPTTHFVGKEDQIHFATTNTSRISTGEQQANFIKVGYSVGSCYKEGNKETTGKCLLRRSSNVVEGDITKGGTELVLIENVEEFKLRYFAEGKQDWVNEWNTISGDGAAKGKFPDLVEISLTIGKGEGTKKRKISMQLIAQIRFPNNEVSEGKKAATGAP